MTQSQQTGVAVVGSITADITSFSERLPRRGETVLGTGFTLVLGGKGANQAAASALAGARTHLVGRIGTDFFGEIALQGLTAAGVRTETVKAIPGPTGIAHIRVDATGENDIVVIPEANARLTPEDAESAIRALSRTCKVLLTQLEIPAPTAAAAIAEGGRSRMTVILDPAPAMPLDDTLWGRVDIVTPNETEAAAITGMAVTDRDSAAAAGRWFLDRGAKCALITLAAAGAVLITPAGRKQYKSWPVTALDTTAAGDAFSGYLSARIAAGATLDGAIPWAMAAGALAVTKRGASQSLPAASEVFGFLNTRPQPMPEA